MDQHAFEFLIPSCPLLERFTLINFYGFKNLNIHAPNLLFVDFGGVFENVNFQGTLQLAVVLIEPCMGFVRNRTFGSAGSVVKFFAQLPRTRRLEVHSDFLQYMTAGEVPGRLPTPCIDLSFLSVTINFNDVEESLAALCILRSSPNLQEFEMLAQAEEQGADSVVSGTILEEGFGICPFNQLRFVKVAGISGLGQELNFIKFLLANCA